jgi:membrane-bound inhibitor of C-type lysozyme
MTSSRTREARISRILLIAAIGAITGLAVQGCGNQPSKEEQEAAKNTFACKLSGERLVIRFDAGEARLLMPAGDRVVLYQIPSASGVRFSNGTMELRGKGTDLQLIADGNVVALVDCKPYELPKPT